MHQPPLSNEQIVEILYLHFLGRKPDFSALQYFSEELDQGRLNINALISALHSSEEYSQRKILEQHTWVPPGHFYSPIVNLTELRTDAARTFDRSRLPPAIHLNEDRQLTLLNEFRKLAQDLPFQETKCTGLYYYYENPSYSYGDAIVLASMIRHARPKRILEFGCGFSSCAILDVNNHFFGGTIECNFVDPYPELLRDLLGEDYQGLQLFKARAQDIDLALVEALEPNDILFIDSTHVSKAGSDVNFYFFDVFPRLSPGVYIHFHDVFYPFQYPPAWFFEENRSWNEIYLLQAFLMYNDCYKIEFFNDFLVQKFPELVLRALPLFGRNSGGAIWLRS